MILAFPGHTHLGLNMTKRVFRVSDKECFKPVFSATETSWSIEIWLAAYLDMKLSKQGITNALIRMHECAGWSAHLLFTHPQRQVFLR